MLLKAYPPDNVHQTIFGMLNIAQETANELQNINPAQSIAQWRDAVDVLATARICVDIAWDTNYLGYMCLAVSEQVYYLNISMLNVLFEDLKRMSLSLKTIGESFNHDA